MLAVLLAALTLNPPVMPPQTHALEPAVPAAQVATPKVKAPAHKRMLPPTPHPLHEAEVRAAKLLLDNALLQQEMARALGSSFEAVTTPGAAVAELAAGNARFMAGRRVRTLLSMQDNDLRASLAKGQAPFAVIVTCSDSRLADNLLFDQEMGRLFTIREAGNSPDIQGLASVEYAVEHLGAPLVVVLGHTGCGAVKAVYEAHGKPLPGNLWSLQAAMAGLLEANHEDPNETPGDHLRRLAISNAERQAQGVLDRSELVRHLAVGNKVRVVPALYDLASGQVTFLELPKGAPAPGH